MEEEAHVIAIVSCITNLWQNHSLQLDCTPCIRSEGVAIIGHNNHLCKKHLTSSKRVEYLGTFNGLLATILKWKKVSIAFWVLQHCGYLKTIKTNLLSLPRQNTKYGMFYFLVICLAQEFTVTNNSLSWCFETCNILCHFKNLLSLQHTLFGNTTVICMLTKNNTKLNKVTWHNRVGARF